MFNILKRNWPIIVIILFVATYDFMFGLEYNLIVSGDISSSKFLTFIHVIIIILLFMGCWIYFIAHSIKNKVLYYIF